MGLPQFATPFDEALAKTGTPAVFTVDAKGELRLAPNRTRDSWARVQGLPQAGWRHCLFRDRATDYVQYVLVTSPDLCREHPRADIAVFPTMEAAWAALSALGRPPLAAALPQPG